MTRNSPGTVEQIAMIAVAEGPQPEDLVTATNALRNLIYEKIGDSAFTEWAPVNHDYPGVDDDAFSIVRPRDHTRRRDRISSDPNKNDGETVEITHIETAQLSFWRRVPKQHGLLHTITVRQGLSANLGKTPTYRFQLSNSGAMIRADAINTKFDGPVSPQDPDTKLRLTQQAIKLL